MLGAILGGMQRSRLSLWTSLVTAATITLLTLAACSPNPDSQGIEESPQPGIPAELAAVLQLPNPGSPDGYFGQDGPVAARMPENKIGVVTWGSSSCPLKAVSVKTQPDNVVELTFEQSKKRFCTDDLAPSSHIFSPPDNTPKTEFTLRLRYNGSSETKEITVSRA